jgi:excisionase family DNA binding protein
MKTNEVFETNEAVLTGTPGPAFPPAAAVPARPDTAGDPRLPRLAYSVKEAAEILGVSDKTIRRLVDRGLLKPSRAIRHLLIPASSLQRFLQDTTAK